MSEPNTIVPDSVCAGGQRHDAASALRAHARVPQSAVAAPANGAAPRRGGLVLTCAKDAPMRVELTRGGEIIGAVVVSFRNGKARAAFEFPRDVDIWRGADAAECQRRRAHAIYARAGGSNG